MRALALNVREAHRGEELLHQVRRRVRLHQRVRDPQLVDRPVRVHVDREPHPRVRVATQRLVELVQAVLRPARLRQLHELRRIGVHLSVDDFGTGYSSLSYLKRLPVQILKVDRTFTSGLGTDLHDTSIVRAISRLAEELGLSLLAEGVETEEQLRALDELGCDLAQGYLWSAPVTAEAITRELTG